MIIMFILQNFNVINFFIELDSFICGIIKFECETKNIDGSIVRT